MYIIAQGAHVNPVAAIRDAARLQRTRALPVRLGRFLLEAWARRLERQMEYAVVRLDHPGVPDDLRASRR